MMAGTAEAVLIIDSFCDWLTGSQQVSIRETLHLCVVCYAMGVSELHNFSTSLHPKFTLSGV
jgi:hypothetical protein